MSQWPGVQNDSENAGDGYMPIAPRGYQPQSYPSPYQPPVEQPPADPLEQLAASQPQTINVYHSPTYHAPARPRSAVAAGFGATFGVVGALIVILVVIPVVILIAVLIFGAAAAATEKATEQQPAQPRYVAPSRTR